MAVAAAAARCRGPGSKLVSNFTWNAPEAQSRAAIRPSLLSLPPQLRTSIYQRNFSASPRSRATLADIAVAGPTAVIDTIHSLGIPYYAALPLTAIFVRSTLVYYVATRPARRHAQIKANLSPLVSAHMQLSYHSPEARAAYQKLEDGSVPPLLRAVQGSYTRFRYHHKAMRKFKSLFGVRWRGYGLLNFGVLIAFTESIRMKCGRSEGLLSVLLKPVEKVRKQVAPGQSPAAGPETLQSVDPAEMLAARLEAAREAKLSQASGGELVDLSGAPEAPSNMSSDWVQPADVQLEALSGIDTSNPYFDSAMQTEGLSWCVDLTAADPTQLLPAALSATMGASFLLRPALGKPSPPTKIASLDGEKSNADDIIMQKYKDQLSPEALAALSTPIRQSSLVDRVMAWRNSLTTSQRLGLLFTILLSFAAINMPAGILLYFIPSIATGWLQQRYLDMKYPIKPAIQPCYRPIRVKASKEW
ncbi:hypothetical protein LTR37_007995 [Vermiconidia calcicola]|uniref:Uncharacterized protein n=1 Tax=Vermiconidia calcicola TaxID=1690605 RepID=A0ACC3NDS2_9PEZI|nr:hypothetical protein LTR37_007995 [Vermiconidia calcicola]